MSRTSMARSRRHPARLEPIADSLGDQLSLDIRLTILSESRLRVCGLVLVSKIDSSVLRLEWLRNDAGAK